MSKLLTQFMDVPFVYSVWVERKLIKSNGKGFESFSVNPSKQKFHELN